AARTLSGLAMHRLLLACAVLLAAPASVGAQCVLSGEATITRVRVMPRGAPPFVLGLRGYTASVAPLDGGRVRVESAGALVWSGTAEASDVSVALARDLRLPGLTLRPGVPVS